MNALQFQTQLLSLQDNMMNFALTLTADKEEAQELLQDTTLKVLDNQEKYVDNINFKGWVLTVMRNIFINNYHKVIRMQSIIDPSTDIYNIDIINDSGMDSPDSSYSLHEINNAINSLSKELKGPFSLYLCGYKYDEISEMLDVPMGTVKSRIFFARQELQNELKEFC